MKRFIEGEGRSQVTLLPECLDDFLAEDNPVRVVDAFVEELDLQALGFESVEPAATGRPAYHPAVLLKIYIYGYLNRVQSSRRLERECQRNIELMWLTGRLAPDFKTIADFRHDSGKGIRNAEGVVRSRLANSRLLPCLSDQLRGRVRPLQFRHCLAQEMSVKGTTLLVDAVGQHDDQVICANR